ncbi:MAG: hypothetical protein M1376_04845 [Planctomycetes bacterium]|nr:hypothetical protein [Planctomycetota bacterium]
MRKTSIISLIVVALGASVAAAGQPVPGMYGNIRITAAGEPNDPNGLPAAPPAEPNQVWDPAAHFVATWESLTSMSKLYNPASKKLPDRSLSIAARVDVLDPNGVIGFDWSERKTLVLDEKGREVYSGKPLSSNYCHFYWTPRTLKKMVAGQWVSELQPYNVAVEIPMDPNRPYPLVLSKVEWSMFALVVGETKTVDVPFRPTTDWITLAPGLEIKVDSITAENGKFDYKLSTRYSRSKVDWWAGVAAIALWTKDPTPEVILTKLDVLDPQGKSILDQGGGFTSGSSGGGSGDVTIGTAHGSGNCNICGTATMFRFTLVLQPAQQELRFVLENVPVPLL